jgi:tRNA(His) 5'-end guanylyltransferase
MEESSRKRARRAQDALGQEMKSFEAATCDAVVDMSRPCVVRLDGHCFHTFTRGFRRPYDLRIHAAMVATATDLLERFGAVTAYTESDEISLLFPPSTPEVLTVPFKGRVQKICSVTAGFASARFNQHMCAPRLPISILDAPVTCKSHLQVPP